MLGFYTCFSIIGGISFLKIIELKRSGRLTHVFKWVNRPTKLNAVLNVDQLTLVIT